MKIVSNIPESFDSGEIIPIVYQVKDQIEKIVKKYEEMEEYEPMKLNEKHQVLIKNIRKILLYWTGYCSVGFPKNREFQKAYTIFFERLLEWLKKLKDSKNEEYRHFADEALFQGTVFRCIHNENDYNKEPVLRYENNFVSWSKNPHIIYFKQKIKGIKMYITCEIKDEYYGIDLEAFDVVAGEEAEVVFPTIKELITKTEVVR